MPQHRTYLERLIQGIDLVGGRCDPSDPFKRFRRRAFIVMLLILALICFAQALTTWLSSQSLIFFASVSILFLLVLLCLGITRQSSQIDPTAAMVLIFLVITGAILEIFSGRSPTTPFVYWSPVIIFGAYIFCGLRWGTLVVVVTMLSALAILVVPFAIHDVRILPGNDVAAFQVRILVSVLLCHLLPLTLLAIYEKFFFLCHVEARMLIDKMEVRKDRTFLGRLAQVLVGEIEPELARMESAYQKLPHSEDIRKSTHDVLGPLQKLVQLTRRYEPLSIGALAAIDKGLALEDFPEILKRFTDFAEIKLEGSTDSSFRFQGGQAFFLLIFLCLSLRELLENPEVMLQQVVLSHAAGTLKVVMQVVADEENLRLSLAQDFLHDLEAVVYVRPKEQGTSFRLMGIHVPLVRT